MNPRRIKGFLLSHCCPSSILVGLRKIVHLRSIKRFTEDQERDLYVVRTLVKEGDTVVDVGANTGDYTVYLSRLVGPSGTVLAIEPVPETFAVLNYIIRKLALLNVQTFNLAASERCGTAQMVVPTYDEGGPNFYQARLGASWQANGTVCDVRTSTLDSLFSDRAVLQAVTFVKIDVEGHEFSCLRGAEKLLSTSRAAWLIELAQNPGERGTPAAAIREMFAERGFECYWFDGKRLRSFAEGDASVNYFFLASEHIARINESGSIDVTR